jgi:hypothetical protein
MVSTLPGAATTKGLNQIITPDIQPAGVLSLSYQQQDPYIGNASQVQFEIGITRRFEAAVFQGFVPGQTTLGFEAAIADKLPYLLSAGMANWNMTGPAPWPFVEGGYYSGSHKAILGFTRVLSSDEAILGYAFQARPQLLLQIDYQSGPGNSATAGFTYSLSPALTVNPSVYVSNGAPHHIHGYVVVSWNVGLWKA